MKLVHAHSRYDCIQFYLLIGIVTVRLANVEIHQLLHHGSTRHATTFVIIVTVKWQHRDLIEGRLNVNERKESTYFPVCAINQSINPSINHRHNIYMLCETQSKEGK